MARAPTPGLATLVAEELDAAWEQVRVEGAPADAKRYANCSGDRRRAPAARRRSPIPGSSCARPAPPRARCWSPPPRSSGTSRLASIAVRNGSSAAATARRASASSPTPRPRCGAGHRQAEGSEGLPADRKSAPRKDSRSKSNGSAQFTCDLKLPDMLTAWSPTRRNSTRASRASIRRAWPACRACATWWRFRSGVAVIANGFWSRRRARRAEDHLGRVEGVQGVVGRHPRRVQATRGDAGQDRRATTATPPGRSPQREDAGAGYEFPYLAHAAMEPLDCVIKLAKDGCEVWNGEQFQTGDQATLARVAGAQARAGEAQHALCRRQLRPPRQSGRRLPGGGGRDREGARRQGKYDVPIKLVWTREDDMTGGYYRPRTTTC